MNHTKLRVGALAAVAITIAAVACTKDSVDVLSPPAAANPIFQRYVALGNSITAGYQSSGISDSTQKESYARLLAEQMHTSYVYPQLVNPGCPPPIANFQTRIRTSGDTISNSCRLRNAATTLLVQNNVAVPGATSFDPTAPTTKASNILTQLFLGGKTQVQRALDAQPTFVSVWIGNNDVLDAAAKGVTVYQNATDAGSVAVKTALSTQGITDTLTFVANYKKMIDQLLVQPNLKGILIGVVDVTQIPFIFSVDSLIGEPATKAYFDAAVGHATTITADCAGSGALVTLGMIQFLKGNPTAPISCTKGVVPTAPAIGDFFILDAADQALFHKVITRYNGYIKAKADSIGFAYLDPNPLLAGLRGAPGGIPLVPVLSSPTATFGPYISLDGIHPSGKAHRAIAGALVLAINAKYGTSLAAVTP